MSITITRAERDLIRGLLWRWVSDDETPFGSREEAEATIAAMQYAMRLLDEIGWAEDDPRETFTVTVDTLLIEALRDEAKSWITDREREINYRETHILGLRPTRFGTTWSDDYETIDEANAAVDAQIARAETNHRMCEELVGRLDAEAVTA